MKVVLNRCYGGFSISPEAAQRLLDLGVTEIAKPVKAVYSSAKPKYLKDDLARWRAYVAARAELGSKKAQKTVGYYMVFTADEQFVLDTHPSEREGIPRHHPMLVQVVEEMGEAANGNSAELEVQEIDLTYEIDDHDGKEHISFGGREY